LVHHHCCGARHCPRPPCCLYLFAASVSWSSCSSRHCLSSPEPRINTSLVLKHAIQNGSLCHACRLGKHTRLPFSTSTSRTSSPFELVHCDVWTSPVPSVSGYIYYLVMLDDFTHYCWTFPLIISLMFMSISFSLFHMRRLSSAFLLSASRLITTKNLLILLPLPT